MKQTKLIEAIANSLKIPSDTITVSTSLSDELGVDSIEMVKLCRDVNKALGCSLQVCEIQDADTIEKIYEFIEQEKQAS